MTGAVPCHEPAANEARSQPTPQRSNQSDNAAPCGYAALGWSASTWRLQIGLNNLPGITSTPATQPLSKRPLSRMNLDELRSNAHRASRLLKALSNERRLMVLCHLSQGEKSVGELERAVGLGQSALSQHLARLRRDALVRTRREAQTIYYSLASAEACCRDSHPVRFVLRRVALASKRKVSSA